MSDDGAIFDLDAALAPDFRCEEFGLQKLSFRGQPRTEEQRQELETFTQKKQAILHQRAREKWLATPAGKLCQEFYQKFQEYKRHLETNSWARFHPNGTSLKGYTEHELFEEGLKLLRECDHDRAEKDRKNLERARLAARCRHRHANGRRCGSPRMRGKNLCYMHEQIENAQAAQLDLGPLEDAAGVQLAIVRLQRAILEGKVNSRQSSQLSSLIRLAAWNQKNVKPADRQELFEMMEEEREESGDPVSG